MAETQLERVESCDEPDYGAIELPAKPPSEYTYVERRAELLQLIEQAGHPRALHQGQLGDRYGVSQQQISKDLDRLATHIDETLGNRRALITESVFHRSISALLDEGEYRKAAQTVKDWNQWLTEYNDLREFEERLARLEER